MLDFKLKPTSATIVHINTRKEGNDEERILAIDAKVRVEGVFSILAPLFHTPDGLDASPKNFENTEHALFDDDGNLRWRALSALDIGGLELDGHAVAFSYLGKRLEIRVASLKKFRAELSDGKKCSLIFSVSFKPQNVRDEMPFLAAALLEDGAMIEIVPPPSLPFGEKKIEAAAKVVGDGLEKLRPKAGSGIESVTISAGGKSVTLKARPAKKKQSGKK